MSAIHQDLLLLLQEVYIRQRGLFLGLRATSINDSSCTYFITPARFGALGTPWAIFIVFVVSSLPTLNSSTTANAPSTPIAPHSTIAVIAFVPLIPTSHVHPLRSSIPRPNLAADSPNIFQIDPSIIYYHRYLSLFLQQ